MKLIIELADSEELNEAVLALVEWYNSPEIIVELELQY